MVSTRQQVRTRLRTEGNPPPAGDGDKLKEQTRKTRKKGRDKTTARGKQQQRSSETAESSRLLNMPIDILYEVHESLLYSRVSWYNEVPRYSLSPTPGIY